MVLKHSIALMAIRNAAFFVVGISEVKSYFSGQTFTVSLWFFPIQTKKPNHCLRNHVRNQTVILAGTLKSRSGTINSLPSLCLMSEVNIAISLMAFKAIGS